MIRRVLEQGYHTVDNERLMTITVYEPGIDKKTVRQENPFSKRHKVLIERNGEFEFKG